MQNTKDIMAKIINKTDILLNGSVISRDVLLKNFGKFITDIGIREEHSVGVAMHTGSICFDVITVTYAALWCLLHNESNSEELIHALENDEMVLYGNTKKERYVYKGFVDGKTLKSDYAGKQFIKLLQDSGTVTYVPQAMWRHIEPYKGTAKKADGRGIRKKSNVRELFFTNVLEYELSNIPSVIDASIVLVMSRDKADMLIKGITIRFEENEINLLELVTASYFTEDDEYRYGGNTSKNEAVIKVTSKISVARTLLYSRRGNFHLGVFLLDKEIICRGYSELPELMNRKSLGIVLLCMPVDVDSATMLLKEYEDAEVFACTRRYLSDVSDDQDEVDNPYIKELKEQIHLIRNKENIIEVVQSSPISVENYREIRKHLILLKRDDYTSQDKDNFIIQSFSLLNFVLTAIFTIDEFEAEKSTNALEVDSPFKKLEQITEYQKSFPARLKDIAEEIIRILNDAVSCIKNRNEKREWIAQFLLKERDSRIAIVVPKAYYVPIIQNKLLKYWGNRSRVSVYTMGKYEQSKLYDVLIAVGDIETKAFNVFRCNLACKVISLLYDVEKSRCTYKMNEAEGKERIINSKANHEMIDDKQIISESIETEWDNDEEITSYIASIDSLFNTYQITNGGYRNCLNAEVIATAVFSDDTKAFFSKRYKGYVFDEATGTVSERSAEELKEGDSLIFTKNTNETKDVVDSILGQLIAEKKISSHTSDAYIESKRWKSALVDYMHQHEMSEREMVEKMLEKGVSVQEATLMIWLDDAAHTVGPRKVGSIISIAEFVEDSQLKEDAVIVYEACREIRRIRRRILEQVGNAIVDKLSGREVPSDSEFAVIYERIDKMAEVKHIDRVSFVEQSVPINFINRPLHV